MTPRALIDLTDEQRASLFAVFLAQKNDPGSALMAQVFPDGIHVALVTSDQVSAIQKVTGAIGTVRDAAQSYDDAIQRELEKQFHEEDHTA